MVKDMFDDETVHLEKRKGTRDQAREYCMKDGDWSESGDWNAGGQGARSNLNKIGANLLSGEMSLDEVKQEEPGLYMKYRNGMNALYQDSLRARARKFRHVVVTVLWGPTGTGKTRRATERFGEDWYKVPPFDTNGTVWFDGYSGESTIIFDDVGHEQFRSRRQQWLNWLDGYALQVPVKGGFVHALWTNVVITTNTDPKEWFIGHDEAFFRRLTTIEHVTELPEEWRENEAGNSEEAAVFLSPAEGDEVPSAMEG